MPKLIAAFLFLPIYAFSHSGAQPTLPIHHSSFLIHHSSFLIHHSSVDSTWKTLRTAMFSIQYPGNWEVDQSGRSNTLMILFSPAESPDDKFRENVNLVAEDLKGRKLDIDQYTQLSIREIQRYFKKINILENSRMKSDYGECQKIIYTATQKDLLLQFEQYCWIIDEKAYVLSFTSEQKQYDRYKETGEAIMDSFKLKK